MRISVLTLFPEMFAGPFDVSILKRAQSKRLLTIEIVNIRDFALDRHRSVDDRPYGGGTGMILRVDVVDRALVYAKGKRIKENGNRKILLLDPQGVPFTQGKAQELSAYNHLILVCGHYEGVDERIRSLVDEELSVGDYILTGGEIAAMAVVDSVVRLLPGVIAEGAVQTESFTANMLEYPQYTRPERYKRRPVPQVLVSGNHEQIRLWRSEQSRKRTKKRRPDLTERTNTRT